MKVYQISAIIIVEDDIDDSRIQDICNENIQTAVMEDFYISNCITHYELKEVVDYPDTPPSEKDIDGEQFNNWIKRSQEVIDQIEMNLKNRGKDESI